MITEIFSWILYFFIYSFFGWVCETIFCSVASGKFENRGFLSGPICPIYAVGFLFVVTLLSPLYDYPIALFALSIVVTGIIEYATSFIMEKMLNIKLWDYSERFMNIKGRVCIRNLLIFGVMSVLAVYVLHPLVVSITGKINVFLLTSVASAFLGVFCADLINTLHSILKLKGVIKSAQAVLDDISKQTNCIVYDSKAKLDEFQLAEKEKLNEMKIKLNEHISNVNANYKRIFKAFPNISSPSYNDVLIKLKEKISERKIK